MAGSTRVFRVFLSSTFSDFKLERDAFQTRVIPEMERFAGTLNAEFQSVDLRWGVSEEDAKAQDTIRICEDEIRRSQQISPRPNFICLIGQRYGWRPLPPELPKGLFEKLLQSQNENGAALLKKWYRLDENTLTPALDGSTDRQPAYILIPQTGGGEENWPTVEKELLQILRQAADTVGIDNEAARIAIMGAATEREIELGAMRVSDAADHVTAFIRTFDDPSSVVAEMTDAEDRDYAQSRLNTLITRLKELLPEEAVLCQQISSATYIAGLGTDGQLQDYLDRFVKQMTERLKALMLDAINTQVQNTSSPRQHSGRPHSEPPRTVSSAWVDRPKIMAAIHRYISKPDERILLCSGAGGSGKTTVMQRAYYDVTCKEPKIPCSLFHVGLTVQANHEDDLILKTLNALLETKENNKTRDYVNKNPSLSSRDLPSDTPPGSSPEDYIGRLSPGERAGLLKKILERDRQDATHILLIDGLDQLNSAGNPALYWLPKKLGKGLAVILSVRSDSPCYAQIKKMAASKDLPIGKMHVSKAAPLLSQWLDISDRQLTREQRAWILGKFSKERKPLYLRLLFEQARRWNSWTPLPEDTGSHKTIHQSAMAALDALIKRHGQILTGRMLTLLAVARDGLSEREIRTILSGIPDVLTEISTRYPNSPEVGTLPDILWSRLFWDVEPFLAKYSGDNHLLRFFHREIHEAVLSHPNMHWLKQSGHRAIANLFATAEAGDPQQNQRRLRELPYHLFMLGDADAFARFSSTLDTMSQAGPQAGGLIDDIRHFGTQLLPPTEPRPTTTIEQVITFYNTHAYHLNKRADFVYAYAFNEPKGTPLRLQALKHYRHTGEPALRLLNGTNGRLATLTHPKAVVQSMLAPDGIEQIVTVQTDGSVTLWSSQSYTKIKHTSFQTEELQSESTTLHWTAAGLYVATPTALHHIPLADFSCHSLTGLDKNYRWQSRNGHLLIQSEKDITLYSLDNLKSPITSISLPESSPKRKKTAQKPVKPKDRVPTTPHNIMFPIERIFTYGHDHQETVIHTLLVWTDTQGHYTAHHFMENTFSRSGFIRKKISISDDSKLIAFTFRNNDLYESISIITISDQESEFHAPSMTSISHLNWTEYPEIRGVLDFKSWGPEYLFSINIHQETINFEKINSTQSEILKEEAYRTLDDRIDRLKIKMKKSKNSNPSFDPYITGTTELTTATTEEQPPAQTITSEDNHGKTLKFISRHSDHGSPLEVQLCTDHIDHPQPISLTTNFTTDVLLTLTPGWSPDGRFFAFTVYPTQPQAAPRVIAIDINDRKETRFGIDDFYEFTNLEIKNFNDKNYINGNIENETYASINSPEKLIFDYTINNDKLIIKKNCEENIKKEKLILSSTPNDQKSIDVKINQKYMQVNSISRTYVDGEFLVSDAVNHWIEYEDTKEPSPPPPTSTPEHSLPLILLTTHEDSRADTDPATRIEVRAGRTEPEWSITHQMELQPQQCAGGWLPPQQDAAAKTFIVITDNDRNTLHAWTNNYKEEVKKYKEIEKNKKTISFKIISNEALTISKKLKIDQKIKSMKVGTGGIISILSDKDDIYISTFDDDRFEYQENPIKIDRKIKSLLSFSPDGKILAATDIENILWLIPLAEPHASKKFSDGGTKLSKAAIEAFDWSADGKYFAFVRSEDWALIMLSADTAQPFTAWPVYPGTTCLAFDRSGKTIATGGSYGLHRYKITDRIT